MKNSEIYDYDKIDPFKEESIRRYAHTLGFAREKGARIVEETIGEPAVAVDFFGGNPLQRLLRKILGMEEFYISFNLEGLGTKNMIAEALAEKARIREASGINRRQLFSGLGQDEMAMTLNDLSSIGSDPVLFEPILAAGSDDYLADPEIAAGLIDGFVRGAGIAKVAIPGGETPVLEGIVGTKTIDIAGASWGIIRPRERLVTGERLEPGLTIYGISSSGIHSNGVSLARKAAEKAPEKYLSRLPSGRRLGEALLTPTVIYSPFVQSLFEEGTDVRYMQPITGHGWGKIMRKRKDLTYKIEFLPNPPEEFRFLQEAGPVSDEEAYKTWNMGVGWIVLAPDNDSARISRAARKNGLRVYELGSVRPGERKVVLGPIDVTYRPR